ncbi:2-oxoglutarate dehydrogenase complex dihydrolipoyllysine-residue succinyltransferase [Salinibius halmophilus]|uniref:2-oxoglutarate dehydrogenase complex dihydrolipoyllysine-residue succinyltransferase n=1 Tax=Salinibius halmophilus TaxID=1853216 RepID=UPI000E66C188|nr:2-oxoglutarate dehydrogenase complex dihydrolipoyllysine-residue succinyltransferase [Salinibius halmophilus]
MTIEIKAPQFPESVADGTVATWHKQPGEPVSRDELIVDIETDKVVLEVVAPADGTIKEIIKNEDDTVLSEEVMAIFEAGEVSAASAPAEEAPASEAPAASKADSDATVSPAARRILDEKGLTAAEVVGTGKNGMITKEDAMKAEKPASKPAPASTASAPAVEAVGDRVEKRVPMTRLRKMVAGRLVEAQQTAAMLTTFNEVDMKPVMDLRKQYKDLFEKKHDGSKLGFMSFFVKAATEALKRFPVVNASIDGDDIVYHGYQDIGIAVSSERGLVVPVLRNAENMGMAEIESTIRDFGQRAQKGALGLDEMQGGTFTITNGGVFGSLISTPILNPPQSAILGMHAIKERPVAVNGQVEIRPMMYLALSYDHRLLDGKEAVQFLVAIKEMLEDPARILLEV